MKSFLLFWIFIVSLQFDSIAQSLFEHGQLKATENGHYLQFEDGTPFFWLGDTSWELFHRLNLNEIEHYLDNRSKKGFNVVQAVVLAELDGLRTPNQYGELPLKTLTLRCQTRNIFRS